MSLTCLKTPGIVAVLGKVDHVLKSQSASQILRFNFLTEPFRRQRTYITLQYCTNFFFISNNAAKQQNISYTELKLLKYVTT